MSNYSLAQAFANDTGSSAKDRERGQMYATLALVDQLILSAVSLAASLEAVRQTILAEHVETSSIVTTHAHAMDEKLVRIIGAVVPGAGVEW